MPDVEGIQERCKTGSANWNNAKQKLYWKLLFKAKYQCIWKEVLDLEMATHSSTLAWRIPWMEEPGGLQSMGSQRVGHDWATSLSLSCIGEGNGNPLQYSCLENPRDGGAWRAAVYGVAQSRTRLKRLSSSSNEYQWELSNFTLRTGRPDLCGGPGVKNPPANQCRRYRFIPGPGRFHMPRSNKAQASQLLSQCALKFVLWGARTLPLERSPHWPQLERVLLQQRRPSEAKNVNKWIKLKKKKGTRRRENCL